MKAKPIDPQLRERTERFRAFKSAWGAVARTAAGTQSQEVRAGGREVQQRLTELNERGGACTASELEEADALLDRLTAAANGAVQELGFGPLRACLPELVIRDRESVLRLLDLILEGDGLDERMPIVEYVITALCTEIRDGRREVAGDPLALTDRLRQTAQAVQEADPLCEALDTGFFVAAARDNPEQLVDGQLFVVRARKVQLGRKLLAPALLRAVLNYNSAMWNRMEDWVARTQDEWDVPDDPEHNAPLQPSEGSVHGHPAIPQIWKALEDRVRGGEAPDLPIDRLVWQLDLEGLESLVRVDGEGEHPIARDELERATIVVSLLHRSKETIREDLAALEIPVESVEDVWVEELDRDLKRRVNGLIEAMDFESASHVSDLRSKFLFDPMAAVYRRRREAGGRKTTDAATGDGMAGWSEEDREWARNLDATQGEFGQDAARKAPRLLTVATTIAVILFAFSSVQSMFAGSDIANFKDRQLSRYSPQLISGYRNHNGSGPLFIGTIKNEWTKLEPTKRERAASRIISLLLREGVSEIMIYDENQQLRIQFPAERDTRTLVSNQPGA